VGNVGDLLVYTFDGVFGYIFAARFHRKQRFPAAGSKK